MSFCSDWQTYQNLYIICLPETNRNTLVNINMILLNPYELQSQFHLPNQHTVRAEKQSSLVNRSRSKTKKIKQKASESSTHMYVTQKPRYCCSNAEIRNSNVTCAGARHWQIGRHLGSVTNELFWLIRSGCLLKSDRRENLT